MSSVRYTLGEFLDAPPDQVLGRIANLYLQMGFSSLWTKSIEAWKSQVPVLKIAFSELMAAHPEAPQWSVLFEYTIPLRDRRPDVLLLGPAVFVIEFKVGADTHDSGFIWQVRSYALDLRDFHPSCRDRIIVPILVATTAGGTDFTEKPIDNQLRQSSFPIQQTNALNLGKCLISHSAVLCTPDKALIDADEWEAAVYSPTPTIIEAAQALFGGHRVQDISHAFSDTLDVTTKAIVDAINQSRLENRRTICFVTGIPGSGKTLVGLNAVHSPALLNDGQSSAIFLSGNGPLVKVIRESLSREQAAQGVRKDDARDVASAFIANVHGFIKTFGIDKPAEAPAQNAIIFDEAQRAWSAPQVNKAHGKNCSEPAMVLDIMARVPNWCAIIALVGGGQEINTGEAGLPEWGQALSERAGDWRVLVSSEALTGGESVAGQRLFPSGVPEGVNVVDTPALHLRVSVRSNRAKFIGPWVNQTLSDAPPESVNVRLSGDFPVVMTRDLAVVRSWLRERQEQKSQRIGLLASSGAIRLRAHGLELSPAFRGGVSYADWFLNPLGDVRSSYQLEVAATEFDCQGLEIDWAGVCWGGDFVVDPASGLWNYGKFTGKSWKAVKDSVKRQYIINKYRVLLTRARRGMIIWVPSGVDAAKDEKSLDATAARLEKLGISMA